MTDGSNASAAAKHLDVSRPWLAKLVEEGVIQQLEGGTYDLDDCRVRYIQHLRQRRTSGKHDGLIEARTSLADLRAAKMRGSLVPKQAAWEHSARTAGRLLMLLEGLPAAFTRDLKERRRLKELIDNIRRDFTKSLNQPDAA